MKMFSRKKNYCEIEPDEIFLDSRNLPEFNVYQFEGRIERPIPKSTLVFLGMVCILFGVTFLFRLAELQIVQGAHYADISENNSLHHIPIFSERGVIYDRNGVELAWNASRDDDAGFSERRYINDTGFGHLLGYVSYPQKDARGFYYQDEFVGKEGVEKEYNTVLSGEKGKKLREVNVFGDTTSEHIIFPPKEGTDLFLTIDARVQHKLYTLIEDLSHDIGFSGGAGVLINVQNGETLAIASYPEYDPAVLSYGEDADRISSYVSDEQTPFLNRAIAGLYAPGSTVKPFFGIAALNEGIIDPKKQIFSSGSISIENPYFPELKTVFNDWKAHGYVDLRRALAVSSNVYFYEIGGGYEDQEGLGIERIGAYTHQFGLGDITGIDLPGEKSGVIPNPTWKAENFDGDEWRIGDTYHTAIGQYGFQITPLQLVRGIAMVANNGMPIIPHVVQSPENVDFAHGDQLLIDEEDFRIVREGMRDAVTDGTARGLLIGSVEVAAKTGTAEVGVSKKLVNSWIEGFFPYDNPQYAFVVVMEKGPRDNLIGGLYVMRQLFEWMAIETPEYLEKQ